jgi:hypothetical protein
MLINHLNTITYLIENEIYHEEKNDIGEFVPKRDKKKVSHSIFLSIDGHNGYRLRPIKEIIVCNGSSLLFIRSPQCAYACQSRHKNAHHFLPIHVGILACGTLIFAITEGCSLVQPTFLI